MAHLTLGHNLTLELLAQNATFHGIGAVDVAGVPLRNGRRPISVDIRTPDGVQLCNYQIVEQQTGPDRIALTLEPQRQPGGLMEWMLHEVRNRYNTADWSLPPQPAADTRLRLEIWPVTRVLGGREWSGLCYQYRYTSDTLPIYKILDRATWEVGGSALGNQIWQRQGNMPPIFTVQSADDWYSTEWYLPSADNPSIFQFFPLQTQLQGFTFTAASAGVLLTWPTEVAHVRTLIEKQRGSDEIAHWHEHCGDLAHSFATTPVEVLWLAGSFNRVEQINLYEAARAHVWNTLHDQVGMRYERATSYGVIEEWGDADLDRYADQGVPKLLAAGVKTIMLANHFENNMNVWGVGNMCCTVDYKVAETVGEQRLRRLCDVARQGGAIVEMWGNTALSTLTLMFNNRNGRPKRIDFLPRDGSVMERLAEAQEPFVRNPSNAIEADHYTPVFAALNIRDPLVRAYWHDRWRAAHDQIGLGGIFLDSSFNMTSDKFHYIANTRGERAGATIDQTALLGQGRPAQEPPAAILSQYRAHLDMMREMQQYGYVYCGEDTGVFGISRSGPAVTWRLDNLFLWNECLADFDVPAIEAAGANPEAVFFQGLAYRQVWKLFWDATSDHVTFAYNTVRGPFDQPNAWHIALFKVFNAVSDLMHNREVLPDEAGVRYQIGDTQLLWAFADGTLALGQDYQIHNLLSGEQHRSADLLFQRHQVYQFAPFQQPPAS